MEFSESSNDWLRLIAGAADTCMKPWVHSVIIQSNNAPDNFALQSPIDLIIKIESRDKNGERISENDLDIEIYQSGENINIMIYWCHHSERPMLWQGKHSVWMDCSSGERCQPPGDGSPVESLARRIQSLFTSTL